jgi:hypothetical protein
VNALGRGDGELEVEEMEQGITGQDLMRRSNEQQLLQQRQRAARGRQPAEIADG